MKKLIHLHLAAMGLTVSLFAVGCASKHDSVEAAKEATPSQKTAPVEASSPMPSNPTEDETNFLIGMADARMMDSKEGTLAVHRGTKADIREYGKQMVNDQAQLLEKIKTLAAQIHVALPTTIGADKSDGLKDLKKKSGRKFDKKFISMITIDHQRDVEAFKRAASNPGYRPEVKAFAAENLPLIQSHLDEINAIAAKR